MKADIIVMLKQEKEHQKLHANHQKLAERHGIDSFSQPYERINNTYTLILDL